MLIEQVTLLLWLGKWPVRGVLSTLGALFHTPASSLNPLLSAHLLLASEKILPTMSGFSPPCLTLVILFRLLITHLLWTITLLPRVLTHHHLCSTTALCTHRLHKLAPLYSYPHLHLYSFLSDFFGFYYSFFATCSPHNQRGEGSIPSAGWSLYTGLELAAETCTSTLLTNPRVPSL